jgi:DNA-binding Lrp family transcriptional regulator
MATPHLKAVSGQSGDIYRLLSQGGDLTAKQIGDQLNILPNSVYRAVKSLMALGMVEKVDAYPVRYRANPVGSAMDWYLRAAARSFRQDFGNRTVRQTDDSLPTITFLKDRQTLLETCEQDARRTTKTLNYIVSGHNIPDSTVLAYRKAATVGARIRAIIQNIPETTGHDLENYKDMGAEVRYLPNIGIRLFVFDGKTAVLTSYDDMQSSRAFGIRFTYAPVAAQLDELFEQRWAQAKPLG